MAAALEYGVAQPGRRRSTSPAASGSPTAPSTTPGSTGSEHYTLTGRAGEVVERRHDHDGAEGRGATASPTCSPASGWARRPASGCPARAPGGCRRCATWSGSTFGNLPIGQGLSMTVLQMAGMYQAVANNGLRIPPRIVEATVGAGRRAHPDARARRRCRWCRRRRPRQLRTMLTAVTQDGHRPARHRARGRGPRLPGGGQDRHGAAGGPGVRLLRLVDVLDHLRRACSPRRTRATSSRSCWTPRRAGTSAAPLFHDIATYLAQREQLPVTPDPHAAADADAPLPPVRAGSPLRTGSRDDVAVGPADGRASAGDGGIGARPAPTGLAGAAEPVAAGASPASRCGGAAAVSLRGHVPVPGPVLLPVAGGLRAARRPACRTPAPPRPPRVAGLD